MANQEAVPSHTTIYYVRSFKLTSGNLRDLLDMWGPDPETETWAHFSQTYPQNDVYLRYVGKVTGKSPLSRHMADARKSSSFIEKFYNLLKKVDPSVIDNAQIYKFYNARLDGSRSVIEKDLPERIAIAFIGIGNLLNVQHGG